MRRANKEKAKLVLKREDIKKALGNANIDAFDTMLHDDLYVFRVKKALLESKKISDKGFLFNDNIYNLPLGKKNSKGEILIANEIVEIFDRYKFARELADKDDVLTAFLVDTSDMLYENVNKALKAKGTEKEINNNEYAMMFSDAYMDVTSVITNQLITDFLQERPELLDLAAEHNLEIKNE